MKYVKCMILLSSLLSFAAWSNFADYNDDKWISNGSHTYHDGTVTETMNRYISSSSQFMINYILLLLGPWQ